MSTTRADGEWNPHGQVGEDLSQLPLNKQDRRKATRKGGWARSCEGSAARRRADEVLARIAALEVSFDRIEEQTIGMLPTINSVRMTGSVRRDATNAPDVDLPADAVASKVDPRSSLEKRGGALGVVGTGHLMLMVDQDSLLVRSLRIHVFQTLYFIQEIHINH